MIYLPYALIYVSGFAACTYLAIHDHPGIAVAALVVASCVSFSTKKEGSE